MAIIVVAAGSKVATTMPLAAGPCVSLGEVRIGKPGTTLGTASARCRQSDLRRMRGTAPAQIGCRKHCSDLRTTVTDRESVEPTRRRQPHNRD